MDSSFHTKPLSPPKRVCLRLKEVREAAGMTLETIAKKTRIHKKYLEALETCRFDDLPDAAVYRKQFIKSYVEALGKDPAGFLEQFLDEENAASVPHSHPKKNVTQWALHNLPSMIRTAVILSVVVSFFWYMGSQVHRIVTPPLLTVYTPNDGFVTDEPVLIVQGKTDPEVLLSVNGIELPHDNAGHFATTLTLAPGVNTVSVTAEKKHGKTTSDTRRVIFKASNRISSNAVEDAS